MNGDASWQTRHDELRALLQQTGAILGDRQAPTPEREAAAHTFIETWQEFCKNLREHPDNSISTRPRG